MSLADYTALKTAIATDWMHRTDLTSQAADFITLFESDFNAHMRVRQMEQSTSLVSTAGYLLHPSNWLGWKDIRGTESGNPYHLEPVTDEIAVARTSGETEPARYYKVLGLKTYLYPAVNSVTFPTRYWEGVALTSGTNWLLTSYPGAYLYGSLIQASAFVQNDPRVPLWEAAYEKILDRIRRDNRIASWSGQALKMNPDIDVQ